MKTAEELKVKCIEKNTMMQDELNQVKYELKMEREKNRRLSLHEELKDGFIAYCEKLQQELTGMKEDCDTADDGDGGNDHCVKEDGKLAKMKLDGKSMADFKLWVCIASYYSTGSHSPNLLFHYVAITLNRLSLKFNYLSKPWIHCSNMQRHLSVRQEVLQNATTTFLVF